MDPSVGAEVRRSTVTSAESLEPCRVGAVIGASSVCGTNRVTGVLGACSGAEIRAHIPGGADVKESVDPMTPGESVESLTPVPSAGPQELEGCHWAHRVKIFLSCLRVALPKSGRQCGGEVPPGRLDGFALANLHRVGGPSPLHRVAKKYRIAASRPQVRGWLRSRNRRFRNRPLSVTRRCQ